jgi:hypothetical protein
LKDWSPKLGSIIFHCNLYLHRESDAVISDLENKIDHVLEKLAMVQSQLEFQKMENEEEVQRLKDQLQGNSNI